MRWNFTCTQQWKCLIFVCNRVWSPFHNIAVQIKTERWIKKDSWSNKEDLNIRCVSLNSSFHSSNYTKMKKWLSKTFYTTILQRKYKAKKHTFSCFNGKFLPAQLKKCHPQASFRSWNMTQGHMQCQWNYYFDFVCKKQHPIWCPMDCSAEKMM